MSTSEQITRLNTARNTIRTKLVDLGLATSTARLDACATAISEIPNCGKVSASVVEGETYSIPRGYHDGSGTVSGASGGGNYSLQTKTITPTKSQLTVSPDSGYYGLSSVTVAAIPEAYHDVSSVTATAETVLANKIFVDSEGTQVAGTMTNNGAVSKTLDTTAANQSYIIPKGYHSGTGTVKLVTETITVTPSETAQDISPTSGKVLSKVTVAAIPSNYVTTDDANAVAEELLSDKTAYVNGVKITGTMANNGSVTTTFDGLATTSVKIPAGYTSGGTVSLTSDIEEALAAI